jgi:hypothetical protein
MIALNDDEHAAIYAGLPPAVEHDLQPGPDTQDLLEIETIAPRTGCVTVRRQRRVIVAHFPVLRITRLASGAVHVRVMGKQQMGEKHLAGRRVRHVVLDLLQGAYASYGPEREPVQHPFWQLVPAALRLLPQSIVAVVKTAAQRRQTTESI